MSVVINAVWLSVLLAGSAIAAGDDLASLESDRTAIERVYYEHRLGNKPPFEQSLPPALIGQLVQQDLRKEVILAKAYGMAITPAMLASEVGRINAHTHAPEVLAELKSALGNDPARFARTVARPILVERVLRDKFANDEALHAPQRREVEQARNELLAAKANSAEGTGLTALLQRSHADAVTETTWQFAARPSETNPPATDEMEIKKRFGPAAKILCAPNNGGMKEQKNYFADLTEPLQNALRAQLRQPGDVSAVIEMPDGFLLYVAKQKTDEVLSVATFSIPKRSYEQWLAEQNQN